jgi:pyrroloquinoline quinone biosynthesis protein B
LPQWNCSCPNCCLARQGKIPARTQSSVAISGDGASWFLVNASPDLRAQIEAFPALCPNPVSARNTPIAGVLLTNADLDHVLGIFLLREGGLLRLHSPAGVYETLAQNLRIGFALAPACKIEHWEPPSDVLAPLMIAPNQPSGLLYRLIELSSNPPPYAILAQKGVQSVAYEIIDERTKGRLVVAPDVAAITPELQQAMETADAVLFDGTFWSNLEFQQITGKQRTADEMGHLPIESGSLNVLRKLKAQHKIYFHINNTNPILAPGAKERAAVEGAGIAVGQDGQEFDV